MQCVQCQSKKKLFIDEQTNILFCGSACQNVFYTSIAGKHENSTSVQFLKTDVVPKIDKIVGKNTSKFIVQDESFVNRVFRQDSEDAIHGYIPMYHINYLSYLLNVVTSYLTDRDLKRIMNDSNLRVLEDDPDAHPGTPVFAYMFLQAVEKLLANSGFAINRTLDNSLDESEQEEFPTRQQWIDQHGGEKRLNSFLVAYNTKTGQFCFVQKSLSIADDQNVYLVKMSTEDRFLVMKWDKDNVSHKEVENYLKIKQLGGSVPDLAPEPMFWKCFGKPVLIMEKLLPLDTTDDEFELGRQLIMTQLPYIHQFAVHLDLKPDNIMKRAAKTASEPPKYFIIDMDLATEKLENGAFERHHATPLYHSQLSMPLQASNYRADLEELFAVMTSMFFSRLKFKQHPWWLTFERYHSPPYFEVIENQKLDRFLGTAKNKTGPPTPEELKHHPQVGYSNNLELYQQVQQSLFAYTGTTIFHTLRMYLTKKVPLGGECPMRVYREMFDIMNNKSVIDEERNVFGHGI